jgi:hypothetical protein
MLGTGNPIFGASDSGIPAVGLPSKFFLKGSEDIGFLLFGLKEYHTCSPH